MLEENNQPVSSEQSPPTPPESQNLTSTGSSSFSSEPPPTEPPLLPPEPLPPSIHSSRRSLKWVFFLILFLLVFVPAGLIFATERGWLNIGIHKFYNKIGLENLWRGFPIDTELALLKVSKKMANLSVVHLNGSLNTRIEGDFSQIPQISKVFPQGTSEGRVLGAQSIQLALQFDGDVKKDGFQIALWLSSSSGPPLSSLAQLGSIKVEGKMTDSNLYVRLPALGLLDKSMVEKWIKIPGEPLGLDQPRVSMDPKKLIDEYKKDIRIKSSNRSPGPKINNESTYHYHLVLDRTSPIYQGLNFQGDIQAPYLLEDPTLDVWIGKKSHYINKIAYSSQYIFSEANFGFNFELSLSKFNLPVEITAPAKEEILEEGLAGIFSKFGGDYRAIIRDVKRKSDLQSIKEALQKYKADTGTYPISEQTAKTKDEGNILAQALVPKYLSNLPVDPNNPTYWYGYRSDGNTFTLWCVLENKNDPAGKQEGDYFIYRIYND